MQHGHLLEKIIAKFNSQFFMNDFVFLNPKYFRGKNEKELSDLLLVLKDKCIVLSVKGTAIEHRSEIKLKNWLIKKTKQGGRQAKGGINWLKRASLTARNLWDEDKKFTPNSLKPICGIVLLECFQQPFNSIEYKFILPKSATPLHVLSVNDFLNVVAWLGSIWDVFDYFSKRSQVSQTFTGINQERPLLAYYTLYSKNMKGFKEEDKEKLCEIHQLYLIEKLPLYEKRNSFIHYINNIVHELHTRESSYKEYVPPEFIDQMEPTERRSAYLQMAAMLNALPASIKTCIGRQIESTLEVLRHSGQKNYFALKPVMEEIVFVFAVFSKLTRSDRIRHLHPALRAALYRHNVPQGLGVAFDADDPTSGFDLTWVRNCRNFTAQDRRFAKALFPNTSQTSVADPFGRTRPYPQK